MNHRFLSVCFFLAGLLFAGVASGATQTGPNFVVNSLADTDDGSCDVLGQGTGNKDCTLREAINAANAYGDGGIITFNLSGTIVLGSTLPQVSNAMTFDGIGQSVVISGNDSVSIFAMFADRAVHGAINFNALTIAHGRKNNFAGMQIYYTNVNVTNCTFNDNNDTASGGGAIQILQGSTVVIANCTFYNNTALYGGGVFVAGVPNGAPSAAYINNCTFSGNHGTFRTGTYSAYVGDIYATAATAEIRNTLLVADSNFQAHNAQGLTYADTSDIFNVDIDDQTFNGTTATTAQIKLDTPKDNGGPTKTMALLPGSVAINAGNNTVSNAAPINNRDQRLFDRIRPGDATCDVGAFESGASGSLVVNTASDLAVGDTFANSLRSALAYAQSLGGARTITFNPLLAGQTVTLNAGWSGAGDDSALRVSGQITLQGLTSSPGVTIAMAQGVQRRHIAVDSPGTLTVSNLTFTNGAANFGGSLRSFGTLTVRGCTFTGNYASADGGAVHGAADSLSLVIENSTFSGNSSTSGSSAITTGAQQTTLRHLTIANNTAASGAILLYQYPTTMVNCLVAGNVNDGIILVNGGAFTAPSTNNILGTGGSGGLVNGVNGNFTGVPTSRLYLGALASNGGPTQTIALLPASLAMNTGAVVAGITTDQRGNARAAGSAPDIGALEDATGNDDPDGDTLTNAQEYSSLTNPLAIDSDADGFNDATELLSGSNPNLATSVPPATHLERVLGFGPARGLDLTGNFRYAFNVGTPGAAGQAGDANFTADNAPGITVSAPNQIANWTVRDFGSTSADDTLETVYRSIRWADLGNASPELRKIKVDLAGLVPGRNYKLQLLFAESGDYNRRFDVFVQGTLLADDFSPSTAQGIPSTLKAAAAIVHEFTATNATLNIVLDGANVAVPAADQNPILNGATLEEIPTVAVAPLITPASGGYESRVAVSMSTTAAGATIYYTTDGSTPSDSHGTLYSGAFSLVNSATVRAIATGGGWLPSSVTNRSYTVLTSLQAWRVLHGLATNGTQDLANPSRDGVTNLLKFAFNMAPNLGDLTIPNVGELPANGTAGLPFIARNAQGRLFIEFVRRKAATNPGIAYVVETGADLTNLTPLDLSGASVVSIDAKWERVTVIDPSITPQRFGRVRVLVFSPYLNDFNAGLGAASLRGSAVWTNSAVKLTDEVTGGAGAVVFDGIIASPALNGFTARFNLALGPISSGVPADGASFAVGDLGTGVWGETGPGTARSLAVGFDTYENGGTGSIGIHVWVNGTHVAVDATNPYTNGVSVPVEISYDTATGVTVRFNGATIFNNVATPGFAFPQNGRFGIGARTGGSTERAVVDDVEITPR